MVLKEIGRKITMENKGKINNSRLVKIRYEKQSSGKA